MKTKLYFLFISVVFVNCCVDVSREEPTRYEKQSPNHLDNQTDLQTILDTARRVKGKTHFKVPPRKHYETLRRSITRLTDRAHNCDASALSLVRNSLKSIGIDLVRVSDGKATYIVLREAKNAYRGAGVFSMRCGKARDLIIQSPHGYFDLNTSGIGYKIFMETRARWFFQNSLHRFRGEQKEIASDLNHSSDVAHNPRLLFQAATLGVLDARGEFLFVQFHGFNASKRGADIVLSDGKLRVQPVSQNLKRNWRGHEWKISIYGKNFRELGAQTNVQGQAINKAKSRFLHIEMSGRVRRALVGSKKGRRALVKSLMEI